MAPVSITAAPNIAAIRTELGLPVQGKLVLCRGGFGAEQALDLFLKAVPYVMASIPTVHFVVLGDGPQRSKVEGETRLRSMDAAVIFTGAVCVTEAERYVAACDLGLYLTRAVGSSLPSFSVDEVYGFLRAGRPLVVASDNADAVCFAQVNNIGVASRLTGDETADLAAIIKNLTFLLVDDRARLRRGECARELGKELFRTSRGGVLDVVRATLRRAASL